MGLAVLLAASVTVYAYPSIFGVMTTMNEFGLGLQGCCGLLSMVLTAFNRSSSSAFFLFVAGHRVFVLRFVGLVLLLFVGYSCLRCVFLYSISLVFLVLYFGVHSLQSVIFSLLNDRLYHTRHRTIYL